MNRATHLTPLLDRGAAITPPVASRPGRSGVRTTHAPWFPSSPVLIPFLVLSEPHLSQLVDTPDAPDVDDSPDSSGV